MITYIAAVLLAAAGASEDQEAHYAHVKVVHEVVAKLAFDPARFFPDEPRGRDLARISYTGDDYGWPVYSIAIRDGCTDKSGKDCHSEFRARMVRAPGYLAASRPRHAGSALIARIAENKTEKPAEIAKALDGDKLDWVETDIGTCPGAKDVLVQASRLSWVRPQVFAPEDTIDMVLHADTVEVEFPDFLRRAAKHGKIAEGPPPQWGTKLAAVLEPCWKPAPADARPW